MGIVSEFREFATRGSLIDVAVGIIIGAAVSTMVGALVDSILMPIIGVFMGGVDFSSLAITVGDANIGYGAFVQALLDFLIIAFVLFMILRAINRAKATFAGPEDEPVVEELSKEVQLLTEIRDQLAVLNRRPPASTPR